MTRWRVSIACASLPLSRKVSLARIGDLRWFASLQAARHPVHFALRSPSGNATLETALFSEEVLQSGGEQLVQSILQHVAERLANYREDPP